MNVLRLLTLLLMTIPLNILQAHAVDWNPVEICDNGIDDDGDGLIDLNDDDCDCNSGFEILDIIPNPNFEDHTGCCSVNLGEPMYPDNCIDYWEIIHKSPDYFHPDCLDDEELALEELRIGNPIENGIIRALIGSATSELFGVCFTDPLQVDYNYQVSFDLLTDIPKLAPLNIAIYGVYDCQDLTNIDAANICSIPEIKELASITLDTNMPVKTWIEHSFSFVTDYPYEAFFIDASCLNPTIEGNGKLLYFDNFTTSKSLEPFALAAESGSLCDQSLELIAGLVGDYTYQWYQNGIAIPMAEAASYFPTEQGVYQLVAIDPLTGICRESLEFDIDESYEYITTYYAETICYGDTVFYHGNMFTEAGLYEQLESASGACDTLHVLLINTYFLEYDTPLFNVLIPGIPYFFNGQWITEPGLYYDTIQNQTNCDSLQTLLLISPVVDELCHNGIDDDEDGLIDAFDSDCACESIEESSWEFDPMVVIPFPCTLPVLFWAENVDSVSYQWYRDSVPLAGETGAGFSIDVIDFSHEYHLEAYNENGCVLVQLNPFVGEKINYFDTISICSGTYTFFDEELDQAGDYTHIVPKEDKCDTTYYLHLDIFPNYSDTMTISICQGESFAFGNELLTEAGYYTENLLSNYGCDSIEVIDLKVEPYQILPTINLSICAGDFYEFGGNFLYESGTYSDTIINLNDCPSIQTIVLEVKSIEKEEITVSICQNESYIFQEETITEAGFYTDTLNSSIGCDSIIELTLFVDAYNWSFQSASICENEFYVFNSKVIDQSGQYFDTITSINFCDSIVVLTLFVESIMRDTLYDSMCENEVYYYHGIALTSPGNYSDTLLSSNFCDSISTLSLQVVNNSVTQVFETICAGETYLFGDEILDQSGNYDRILTNQNACDSLILLDLIVLENEESSFHEFICSGEVYAFGGDWLEEAGNYQETLVNQEGCDSVVNLTLEVLPSYTVEEMYTLCAGDELVLNGESYTESGAYQIMMQSQWGCDSIVYLDVNFEEEIIGDTTYVRIPSDGQYEFQGSIYDDEGLHVVAIQSQANCDSLVFLDLRYQERIYIPNVFSPNGDGINDDWRVFFSNPSFELKNVTIYDRWGNQVYHLEHANEIIWDGKSHQKNVSLGVYVYALEYVDLEGKNQLETGTVTIIH